MAEEKVKHPHEACRYAFIGLYDSFLTNQEPNTPMCAYDRVPEPVDELSVPCHRFIKR